MGINVRKKAENIVALLNNKDKIEEARKKAATTREKCVLEYYRFIIIFVIPLSTLQTLMKCFMHLFIGMLASHLLGCRTSQVQLHMVVTVPRAATGMEGSVADMMMMVTGAKMKIILDKINLRNLFPSHIKELLLKGKHLIIAGKLENFALISLFIFFLLSPIKVNCFACS